MNNELISKELLPLRKNRHDRLQAIKERLQSGFYDDNEVLEELAARLLEAEVLDEDVNLQRKAL